MFPIKRTVTDDIFHDLLNSNKEFSSPHGNMRFLHFASLHTSLTPPGCVCVYCAHQSSCVEAVEAPARLSVD